MSITVAVIVAAAITAGVTTAGAIMVIAIILGAMLTPIGAMLTPIGAMLTLMGAMRILIIPTPILPLTSVSVSVGVVGNLAASLLEPDRHVRAGSSPGSEPGIQQCQVDG